MAAVAPTAARRPGVPSEQQACSTPLWLERTPLGWPGNPPASSIEARLAPGFRRPPRRIAAASIHWSGALVSETKNGRETGARRRRGLAVSFRGLSSGGYMVHTELLRGDGRGSACVRSRNRRISHVLMCSTRSRPMAPCDRPQNTNPLATSTKPCGTRTPPIATRPQVLARSSVMLGTVNFPHEHPGDTLT